MKSIDFNCYLLTPVRQNTDKQKKRTRSTIYADSYTSVISNKSTANKGKRMDGWDLLGGCCRPNRSTNKSIKADIDNK